ncbi:conjugative transposon protein TraM [Bacteroides fragilis]|nr:conjugative transposon protein TraM [Bacteroides fragilis]
MLPFEKQVYSEDAIQGIYVPGNVKAETAQEAGAAGISGANTNISGGFDMGSQLVAGAANSVINATKSAASKNIRKVKVTIKTNYRILLRQPEE